MARLPKPKDWIARNGPKLREANPRSIARYRNDRTNMRHRRDRDYKEMELLGILPRFERVFEQRLKAAGPRRRKWYYWDIYREVYDEVYRGMDEE